MQTWTARIGSMIYVLGITLVIGLFAYGRTQAQAVTGTECAKEGESCAFTGTAEVAYGVGNKWAKKVATGSISCTNSAFGDPAPNQAKTCVLTTTQCADETGRCEFKGVRTVKYGANGTFAVKT